MAFLEIIFLLVALGCFGLAFFSGVGLALLRSQFRTWYGLGRLVLIDLSVLLGVTIGWPIIALLPFLLQALLMIGLGLLSAALLGATITTVAMVCYWEDGAPLILGLSWVFYDLSLIVIALHFGRAEQLLSASLREQIIVTIPLMLLPLILLIGTGILVGRFLVLLYREVTAFQ